MDKHACEGGHGGNHGGSATSEVGDADVRAEDGVEVPPAEKTLKSVAALTLGMWYTVVR